MGRRRLIAVAGAVVAAVSCLAAAGSTATASAAGSVPGAAVGFWAGESVTPCVGVDPESCPRDLSAYTPAVWDALANSHGTLYFDLVYHSDFGPAVAGVGRRTDGLSVIQQAAARGIAVNAWITVPLSEGTFANEQNAATIQAAVKDYATWVADNHLTISKPVLDLEFPAGYQALAEAFTSGDLTGIENSLKGNIDPVGQCQAMTTYRDTVTWAHQHGMRIGGSPVFFALDDLADGSTGLQDAEDIAAFPPISYDQFYLQAYRAFGVDLGQGWVASEYQAMQKQFGAVGQVSLGNTGYPPYTTAAPVISDVRMLAGLGATDIPIFDLDQSVKTYGAAGVQSIVDAGHNPMTGAELAAAVSQPSLGSAVDGFFHALDSWATTQTLATTTAEGHPQLPNAYPNGCGQMTTG